MMYVQDFKNAINDYLIYSGMDPEDWDVNGAALRRCHVSQER